MVSIIGVRLSDILIHENPGGFVLGFENITEICKNYHLTSTRVKFLSILGGCETDRSPGFPLAFSGEALRISVREIFTASEDNTRP